MKRHGQVANPFRIGVAALVAILGAGCAGEADPVAEGFRDLPADHVVWDLDTDIKDLGALRARIHADTAYIWEDSAKTLMMPVEVKLYDENGQQTANLTADEGELDSNTNKMVARGNVVLVTVDGDRRILTEELHYDPRIGRIWSEVHTVMIEGETRIEGTGFRANEDMTDIEVYGSTGENIEIEF
ncbi:MAG: LPS export ABC transporter periplasmic protein LptC [Gemmatimonadota bacterium]